MKKFMFATGLALSLGLSAAAASAKPAEKQAPADFTVAVSGKDTNRGTAMAPFATLAKAREAVREKIKAGLAKDLVVEIRGGTYPVTETLTFGPEDSGTERFSITYAAAPGEKVVLSGGRKITGWKKGTNEIWTAEIPEVKAGGWYPRQLFVNGQRAIRARTPNADDKTPWWKIKSSDAKPGAPDQNSTPITVSVDHPIKAWKNITDVELIYLNNNDGSRKRVGAVDEAGQSCTLPPPHQWPPTVLPGEYQIGHPVRPYACYFENALEMLDEPGEWYLDRTTGVLAYWPRPGENLKESEVIAPVVQNTLLAVTGVAEQPVRNLHFKGIHVEHVDRSLPSCGYAAMFGCLQVTSDGGKPPIRFVWIEAAVSFKYARACNFTDGGVARVGGIGLSLLNGCTRNVIEGNQIFDLGGGGVTAGAIRNRDTWKWADPIAPDDHQGYRIANNYIHDCGADYFGAIGIFVGLTQEALVSHNLIHDTAYAGIVFSGNETPLQFARNNVVEYNHLHHVQKMAVDGGGIYAASPHADRGIVIRGNLIHDITGNPVARGPGWWSGPGIYLDAFDAAGGCINYLLEGNVIYRVVKPIAINGSSQGVTIRPDNTCVEQGTPPKEVLDAIQAKAGLEPAYRQLSVKTPSSADGKASVNEGKEKSGGTGMVKP